MSVFTRFSLFLVIAVLVACSTQPEAVPTAPPPTPEQTKTSTPESTVRPAPTTEPQSAALAAPGATKRTKLFIAAPDRDLFRLTRELVPGSGDIPRTVIGDTADYLFGRVDTFWLVALAETEAYQSTFELALVTPNAYWYVEEALKVSLSGL